MQTRSHILQCLPWLAGLLAVATLGGAAVADEAAPARTSAPQPSESPELALHIQAALADAARRTGIDTAALKVVSAERVTWLDASLGCPEPDLLYAQVLVPGYRIGVRAGGETLDYHAGTRGAPLSCPPGRAVDPALERRSSRNGADEK